MLCSLKMSCDDWRLIAGVCRNQHITATLRDIILAASASAHSVQSRPDGVWLWSWQGPGYFESFMTSLYYCSHCRSLCSTIRSADHGDSAASAHLHHLCGTTFCLNWRTATLVDRVLNPALNHGFLSVPTRNRRLCELVFKGQHKNPRFDWIDWLYSTST